MRFNSIFLMAVAFTVLWATAGVASAESLQEALASAYSSNPTLRAERARQRGTDELVPQALSGWRPTVTAQASFGVQRTDNNVTRSTTTTPGSVTISLSQPIFRGFRTVSETGQAESNVQAGRQNLLAVEEDILFQGVQAYMNVLRDRQVVALRKRNVSALQQELNAANERFKVGEITRTDVAQSRARVAQAQGAVASAQATLDASVANYIKVVGHSPGTLHYPPLGKLPRSLEKAQAEAQDINPNILAAAFVQDAATFTIALIRGELLPEISLNASATVTSNPQKGIDRADSQRLEGVLTVPIYEAGRTYSRVRQSKQVASQRSLEVIQAVRAVREAVSNAWHFLQAAQAAITSNKAQVSASQLALEGVRQEYLVGSRTTLDVLNAQTDVVNARISLVLAERDRIVASYQVLASVGKLTARKLGLHVEYYDVEENYLRVRNKWIGTAVETVE